MHLNRSLVSFNTWFSNAKCSYIKNMSLISRIAQNSLKRPVDGTTVTFNEIWKDQRCVIVFFRRWGWPYCRLAAREISLIQPQLKEHNVRLIGIGLEPLGLQEFLDGNFFAGELYVDKDKKAFSRLNFKRLSFLQLFPAVFAKKAREAVAKAKVECKHFFTLRIIDFISYHQGTKSKFVWSIQGWHEKSLTQNNLQKPHLKPPTHLS